MRPSGTVERVTRLRPSSGQWTLDLPALMLSVNGMLSSVNLTVLDFAGCPIASLELS